MTSTRDDVNKALQAFSRSGWIAIQDRGIIILDRDGWLGLGGKAQGRLE